jgi:hypothetical protein
MITAASGSFAQKLVVDIVFCRRADTEGGKRFRQRGTVAPRSRKRLVQVAEQVPQPRYLRLGEGSGVMSKPFPRRRDPDKDAPIASPVVSPGGVGGRVRRKTLLWDLRYHRERVLRRI